VAACGSAGTAGTCSSLGASATRSGWAPPGLLTPRPGLAVLIPPAERLWALALQLVQRP